MELLQQILTRNNLMQPDGRPLFAYETTADEMTRLTKLLRFRIESGQRLTNTAQAFVLWASEWIRKGFPGGKLSWEFVFEGLGLPPQELSLTYWLVDKGLHKWGRVVRHFDHGNRAFLYTLLAEGGLPDAALREAGSYRSVLLSFMAELEGEGALAPTVANAMAVRHVGCLPQALRNSDQEKLLVGLVLALIDLRRALPEGVSHASALSWLDANQPGWQRDLPLRLSADALESIVRPALTAERPRVGTAPVQRELRRDSVGVWHGTVRIIEGALIPNAVMPEVQGRRLRLVAGTGAAFIGQPESGGWQILRSAGKTDLPLAPQDSLALKAYVDGRQIGEVVLDPGLSRPDQAPTLWRPTDHNADSPEVLVPLSGRGQTRAQRIWVLVQDNVRPECEDGLSLSPPEQGPNGSLWPVEGQGRLRVGTTTLTVRTGAEADSPAPKLLMSGQVLSGVAHTRGIPVYIGFPQIWGAEGNRPLRQLVGSILKRRPMPEVLCGELVEWIEDGVVLAQMRLIALPVGAKLSLSEIANGQLCLRSAGLGSGWSVVMNAGGFDARGLVDSKGNVALHLEAQSLPGLVTLRLREPTTGAALELSALWPARQPRLIAPDGQMITVDRPISHQALLGWRGYLPGKGGAALIRLANKGKAVGFAAQGEVSFASLMPLIRQAVALTGADGRVNLRLVSAGSETPRLPVGRYDWDCGGRGTSPELGAGRTRLTAVNLHDHTQIMRTEAEGCIDIADWLGDSEGLWFIQGTNDIRGLMRPFAWSAQPIGHSTREERLVTEETNWNALLEKPADPGWDTSWALISAVREEGDAGALDQVQALARTPAAAVAILMIVPRGDRAVALALETEAPLWWPLVSVQDWAMGVSAAHRYIHEKLDTAGLSNDDSSRIAAEAMAKAASEVVMLRPELAANIGYGLQAAGLGPEAADENGGTTHLLPPADVARVVLSEAAQDAGRRFEALPDGVGDLYARQLLAPDGCNEANAPLLHAPLVAAEVATGLRPALEVDNVLRLIALREADEVWFDRALPAALTLALSEVN